MNYDLFLGDCLEIMRSIDVACVRMGINYIGCDIDPTYFSAAQRRIAAAFRERTAA